LLDSNEELQVANEELMLTHEELQASIEELETNNEEFQATNEELETTNEELRARQEVEQLNRLKDEFLALASHELRTPLTSIIGNAELLQRRFKRLNDPEKEHYAKEEHILDSIIHQTHRLNALIGEMADITSIRNEHFELRNSKNVNIVKLVRLVVEQQNVLADHPISLETQEENVAITCDEGRLEQVLNNLICNAIKYSPPGKAVVVGLERKQHEVMFSVRDQGVGISEEQQAHIFERFYRVRTDANERVDGLGLGLYIAYEIVARHGGRMWLESRPGQGSAFFFSLPLSSSE
jgi:signal transduction histidine kinase